MWARADNIRGGCGLVHLPKDDDLFDDPAAWKAYDEVKEE
jgi:hypothetical protein